MPIRQDPRTKRWYYRFYRGRSYFKGGFRSHGQAREAERTRLNCVIEGGENLERSVKTLTLAEAGQMFFENHAKKTNGAGRMTGPRIAALSRYFGRKRMNQVMPEELDAFLDAVQRDRGLSDHTRNHYLALVKAIYNRLKKWRLYFGGNPAAYL